jgi:hypothetical protein
LSRLRIFALLATVVALAGALTACGGGSDSSDEDPQKVIENATLEGVKSGTIDLSLGIKSEGEKGGNLDVSLSGPFQARAAGTLPEFDFSASAQGDVNGDKVDLEGGLTLLSDRAFIDYQGTEYEVDPTTFGFVKSGFEQAQAQGGSEGGAVDPTACQEAVSSIDLNTVVENLTNEGSADVDGTSTTKVSGEIDPNGAIDAIIALTDDPACASQLEAAGPLPLDELDAMKGEVTSALEKAHVEIYVGDDEIVRKVVAEVTVEPKDKSREKVELDFSLALGGVNETQAISAPAGAEPLEGLFDKLGVDPLELLEAGRGGGLGGLLEGLGGDSGGSGSEPELEVNPEDLPDAEAQREYLECLKEADTANDLQSCTSLLG